MNIWQLPNNEYILSEFIKYMNSDNIILLDVPKNNEYKPNNCHNNVNHFIKEHGYDKYGKILGYYLLINNQKNNILAILHSVIINLNTDEIFDITPCIYDKKLFIYNVNKEYKSILYSKNKIKTTPTLISNIYGYVL